MDITTDPMDIKRITKGYYKIYAHKFDNLDEMEKLHKRHNLFKFKQDKINHVNRPVSIKGIKSIINKIFQKRVPGPNTFTEEFYKIFKEESMPNIYNLIQKRKEIFPN